MAMLMVPPLAKRPNPTKTPPRLRPGAKSRSKKRPNGATRRLFLCQTIAPFCPLDTPNRDFVDIASLVSTIVSPGRTIDTSPLYPDATIDFTGDATIEYTAPKWN
eukprot:801252-Prymnesium_polylepis.1